MRQIRQTAVTTTPAERHHFLLGADTTALFRYQFYRNRLSIQNFDAMKLTTQHGSLSPPPEQRGEDPPLPHSLSLSHTDTNARSLSQAPSPAHTQTYSNSHSRSHTKTHSLSRSLSFSLSTLVWSEMLNWSRISESISRAALRASGRRYASVNSFDTLVWECVGVSV